MSTPRCEKCGGHREGSCCQCGYRDWVARLDAQLVKQWQQFFASVWESIGYVAEGSKKQKEAINHIVKLVLDRKSKPNEEE